MKTRHALFAFFFAASFASAASAQDASAEWFHNAAGMGQFEGGYGNLESGLEITYACTFSSRITFAVKGMKASPGDGAIEIDGKRVREGSVTYHSSLDYTSMEFEVDSNMLQPSKDYYNEFLTMLAGGTSGAWILPSGESYPFTLKGSSDVKNCLFY